MQIIVMVRLDQPIGVNAMIVVNTYEAKTRLSELLRFVDEKHETVRICRNGKVVADIVSPRKGEAKNDPLARHPEIMGVKIKCDLASPVISEDELPDYMR